jgi:antitoxin VapB
MIGIIGGSDMNTAKVFTTGRSQAVRLPKEFRFKGEEVGINKIGDLVVLFPRKKGWDILAKSLELFGADFLADRNQPRKPERRKAL